MSLFVLNDAVSELIDISFSRFSKTKNFLSLWPQIKTPSMINPLVFSLTSSSRREWKTRIKRKQIKWSSFLWFSEQTGHFKTYFFNTKRAFWSRISAKQKGAVVCCVSMMSCCLKSHRKQTGLLLTFSCFHSLLLFYMQACTSLLSVWVVYINQPIVWVVISPAIV